MTSVAYLTSEGDISDLPSLSAQTVTYLSSEEILLNYFHTADFRASRNRKECNIDTMDLEIL